MADRMHPEDLRALVAALMSQGVRSFSAESWEATSIRDADALLAELDRTAKSEHQDAELALGRLGQIRETTGIPYEVEPDLVGVVKQILARAEAAEAREADWITTAHAVIDGGGTPDQVAALVVGLRARVAEMESQDREGHAAYTRLSKEKADLIDRLADHAGRIRQDGAQAERERLCRLFTRTPFQIRVACPCSTESTSLTYETALRHAEAPVQP